MQSKNTLQLIDKEILIKESQILYDLPLSKNNLKENWEIFNCSCFMEDEWLNVINKKESAGMILLKDNFPADILIEFEGRTVPPCSHDLNFIWNGEWSDSLKSCSNAYIAGLCGWWSGKTGIEKSPEYKLRATTPYFRLTPGKSYKIQAGSIKGNCFIFIDGKEIIELNDPEPFIDSTNSRFGFSAWSSHFQVKNIVIRKAKWKSLYRKY